MIILLSLVCAIQAFLTLCLFRKVACMQAGILIADAEKEDVITMLEDGLTLKEAMVVLARQRANTD